MSTSKVTQYIPPEKITTNIYETFKSWSFSNEDTGSLGIAVGKILSPNPETFGSSVLPISKPGVTVNTNPDGRIAEVLYYRNLYERARHRLENELYLGQTGSYLSIPTAILGEGLRRDSLVIEGSVDGTLISLREKSGLLVDTSINSSSVPPSGKVLAGFNANTLTGSIGASVETSNIVGKIGTGLTISGSIIVGSSVVFESTSSVIVIPHSHELRQTNRDDYSVVVNFNIPVSQSKNSDYVILGSKRSASEISYPFEIRLGNNVDPNRVVASLSSTDTPIQLKSTSLTAGDHFTLFTKSGSNALLYVDGQLAESTPIVTQSLGNLVNNSPIYIGADSKNGQNFSGSIERLTYYRTGLSLTHAQFLSGTGSNSTYLGTNVVGIVDHAGTVLVNSLNPLYGRLLLGSGDFEYTSLTNFSCSFESTLTINEFIVNVNVKGLSHNYSLNRSFIKKFSEGTQLSPYVTTIGLYDKDYQLMAVGKLSQPMKKVSDVDINLKVQMDI